MIDEDVMSVREFVKFDLFPALKSVADAAFSSVADDVIDYVNQHLTLPTRARSLIKDYAIADADDFCMRLDDEEFIADLIVACESM